MSCQDCPCLEKRFLDVQETPVKSVHGCNVQASEADLQIESWVVVGCCRWRGTAATAGRRNVRIFASRCATRRET